MNTLLAEHGRPPLSLADVRSMVGDGAARLVSRALEARSGDPVDPAQALARFLELYQAVATEETRPYEGVEETLDTLSAAGVTLGLCTNKPERSSRVIMDTLGLAPRFAHFVCGDTTPWRKPDPRMLQHLLDIARVERGQALMVGDSEVDGETARAAGVPFVLMTYGYRRRPIESISCLAALGRFDFLPTFLDRLR